MKICIFGAGAIGGYMGVMLKRGGADVSVIARGAHLAAIREKGLTVQIAGEDVHADIAAAQDPKDLGPQDVVIVGLKAYQAWEQAEAMAPLLGPETMVVTAQNGVPWWYFYGLDGEHANKRLASVDPATGSGKPSAPSGSSLHGLSGDRTGGARRDQTHLRRPIRSRRAEPPEDAASRAPGGGLRRRAT